MNQEKIGKFLAELRHEKGLTQEGLAYELLVSRETVSKWERGINLPTTDSLLLLAKFYNVSVGEILLGERENEKNKEQLGNVPVEALKVGEKKVKKLLKRFIIIISFMLMAFLAYYFINTYKTIKVYKIDGMSDNFFIKDGLAIFSKGKSYLRIGTIEPKTDIKFDRFEIFIKDKDKEKIIFFSNDDNYTLLSDFGYDEIFVYKNLGIIENNTYIRIIYQDKEDVVKLNFQRDMVNNLFVTQQQTDIGESKANYNMTDIQKLESYVKSNWKYNSNENSYEYRDKNNKYELTYQFNPQILRIEEYEVGLTKIAEISLLQKNITYLEEKNEKVKTIFQYDLNNNCISGECDEKQINYYLDNYLNKYIK